MSDKKWTIFLDSHYDESGGIWKDVWLVSRKGKILSRKDIVPDVLVDTDRPFAFGNIVHAQDYILKQEGVEVEYKKYE